MFSFKSAKRPQMGILFVCMGNICRSPTAQGVLAHKARQRGLDDRLHIDSAGTHNFHPGSPPDDRTQRHARQRGYDLSRLRARRLKPDDFAKHELILVMDWDNLHITEGECPDLHRHKIRRLTEFCRRHQAEGVPDPYYGGPQGFEVVLDLIEDACEGLLDHVQRRLEGTQEPLR